MFGADKVTEGNTGADSVSLVYRNNAHFALFYVHPFSWLEYSWFSVDGENNRDKERERDEEERVAFLRKFFYVNLSNQK